MQKRRVGTISMAVVLIAFGIIIFIAQVNKLSAVELSIKFWPITLFLLGGEILWFSYKYKGEDVKVQYDVLSVFIVLLIVAINIGIYGLVETDIISKINTRISSETYTFNIPHNELKISDGIEKIIINSPRYRDLTIRSGESNKLISSGSVDIVSDSKEKAEELLDNEYIITKELDNVLYVSFMDTPDYNEWGYSIRPYSLELIIPESKKVEIDGGDNLHLIADNIKNDWIIDNVNRIKIRLGKDIDVKINASVYDKETLRGNVKWNTTEIENEEDLINVKGQLIYGNGNNTMNIFNSDEIVIDELE